MDRYSFELLSYLAENKNAGLSNLREISDALKISMTQIKQSLQSCTEKGFINNLHNITDLGLDELEPYHVKKAVIMAAGFGSRMMPATTDRPKPLVLVNGKRIIETLLDALVNVGIKDIVIIRGYKKEKFNELLFKYPFIKFIDNDLYDKENNISSVIKAIDYIDNCYLCESDLYISNPKIIKKYQYTSNILGSYSLETDDWSFELKDGYISNYKKGNKYCYNYYGISYWTKDDSYKLRKDWKELYKTNKNIFWEEVPLVLKKDNYKVEIRHCEKNDIIEIDNYYELAELDNSYKV